MLKPSDSSLRRYRAVRKKQVGGVVPPPTSRPSPDQQDRQSGRAGTPAQTELKKHGFQEASRREMQRRAYAAAQVSRRNPARATDPGPLKGMRPAKAGYTLPYQKPATSYASTALRSFARNLAYTPAGLIALQQSAEKAISHDPNEREKGKEELRDAANAQVEILRHPLRPENVISAALMGRVATSTAASGIARASAAAREGPAAALTRPLPADRTFSFEGVSEPGLYSRSKDVEYFQRLTDRIRNANPNLGFKHGPAMFRDLPSRLRFEAERNREIREGKHLRDVAPPGSVPTDAAETAYRRAKRQRAIERLRPASTLEKREGTKPLKFEEDKPLRRKDAQYMSTDKVLRAGGGGAFRLSPKGGTATLVDVSMAKERQIPVELEGLEGRDLMEGLADVRAEKGTPKNKVILEPDGTYSISGGFKNKAVRSLEAPKGKVWAQMKADQWKLIDEPSDALEALRKDLLAVPPDKIVKSTANAKPGDVIPGTRWVDARLLDDLTDPDAWNKVGRVLGDSPVGKSVRGINNFMRLSIFYTAPKYGPPNALGNMALNFIQQGHGLPGAWKRASVDFYKHRPGFRQEVDEGMGVGVAESIMGRGGKGYLGKVTNKAAHAWSKVLDLQFRRAAFMHEAKRAGFKTQEQREQLLINPKFEDQKMRVFRRARNEILDYTRTGRAERALSEFLFIYPFTKASTVYLGQFLLEHPAKAAIFNAMGAEGQKYVKKILGDVPSFAEGAIPSDGGKKISLPSALTPLGPGLNVLGSATSLAAGDFRRQELPFSYASPLMKALYTASTGYEPFFGREVDPGVGTFLDQLRQQMPQYRLYKGLRNPLEGREDVVYPMSRADYVKQFVGGSIVPRPVNKVELTQRGQEEARSFLNPVEREQFKYAQYRFNIAEQALKTGLMDEGKLPESLDRALTLHEERSMFRVRAKQKKGGKLNAEDRWNADVDFLRSKGLITPTQASGWKEQAKDRTDHEMELAQNWLYRTYFEDLYGKVLSDGKRQLRDQGIDIPDIQVAR